MVLDPAHTDERRPTEKAKTLARWCYQHGVGPDVLDQPDDVLRTIARSADVPAPHREPDDASPSWEQVAQLLRARAVWDAAHQIVPPAQPVACIPCTVTGATCSSCSTRPPICSSCATRMDPVLIAEGLQAHPSCPPPISSKPAEVRDQPPMF